MYKLKIRVHANNIILSLIAMLRFWINSKCHYIQTKRLKRTQKLYSARFSLCMLIENLSNTSQTPLEPIKSLRVIHLKSHNKIQYKYTYYIIISYIIL